MAFDIGSPTKWVAAVLLVSATAFAGGEPTAADRESARAYMTEGRQRRDSGDLKAALKAFEAADAVMMHVPTAALEVARTQAMMGQIVEARDLALQLARSQAKPGEPAPFQEARAGAQKLADDLEARIPSIRIVLKNAADGTQVTIDDVVLPPVAVGLPRKLDPGSHTVVAKLGAVERRMTIQVLEREAKDVPIDLSEAATAQASLVTHVDTTTPPPHAAAPSRGPWLALGITGLGLAAVGVAVGSVTGLMSISETNDVKSQCNGNACPPTLSDGRNTNAVLADARTVATVSTAAFIAAGVCGAAGVIFVVVASRKSRTTAGIEEHARLQVGVGPMSLGLAGTF